MKAKVAEYNGCFGISLEAETIEEMAELVRLGINRTLKLKWAHTNVYKDGSCYCHLTVGKRKRVESSIQPAK